MDLATLKIELKGADSARRELKGLADEAERAEKATKKTGKTSGTARAQKEIKKVADSYRHADAAAEQYQKRLKKLDYFSQKELAQAKKTAKELTNLNTKRRMSSKEIQRYEAEINKTSRTLFKHRKQMKDTDFRSFQQGLDTTSGKLRKLKQNADFGYNSLRKFWERFGKVGLGFSVIYGAIQAASAGFQQLGMLIKEGVQQAGELVALRGKLAMWASMASDGAMDYAEAFRKAKVNTTALADESVTAISSLDELNTAMDELGQSRVILPANEMKEFANLVDFTVMVAQTTGSTMRQVRQELQSLMQGQMRPTNILIRTAEHLGILTEEQVAGLRKQEGRLKAIHDIMAGINEYMKEYKKVVISADVNTAFKMWRDSLVRVVSKSEEMASKQEGLLSIFGQTAYKHFDKIQKKIGRITEDNNGLGNFLKVVNAGFDEFLSVAEKGINVLAKLGDHIWKNKEGFAAVYDAIKNVSTALGGVFADAVNSSLSLIGDFNSSIKNLASNFSSSSTLGQAASSGAMSGILVKLLFGKTKVAVLVGTLTTVSSLMQDVEGHAKNIYQQGMQAGEGGILGYLLFGSKLGGGLAASLGAAIALASDFAEMVKKLREETDKSLSDKDLTSKDAISAAIKEREEQLRKIRNIAAYSPNVSAYDDLFAKMKRLREELETLREKQENFKGATEEAGKTGVQTYQEMQEALAKFKKELKDIDVSTDFFGKAKEKLSSGEGISDRLAGRAVTELGLEISSMRNLRDRLKSEVEEYMGHVEEGQPIADKAKQAMLRISALEDRLKKYKEIRDALESGNYDYFKEETENVKKTVSAYEKVIERLEEEKKKLNLTKEQYKLYSALKSADITITDEMLKRIKSGAELHGKEAAAIQKKVNAILNLKDAREKEQEQAKKIKEELNASQQKGKEDLGIRKEFEDKYKKTTTDEYALKYNKLEEYVEKVKGAYERVGLSTTRIDKFYAKKRKEIAKEEAEAKLEASEYWKDGVKRGLNDIVDGYTDAAALMENATTSAFNSMTDSLVNFVMEGKFQWRDLARSILEELTRVYIKMEVIGRLASGLASMSNSNSGSWTGLLSEFGKGFGQAIWGSGGTTSGGLSTSSNFISSSGGHLNAYASGGLINEPVFGMGQKTGENYLIGESGPEYVTPARQMQNQSPPPITVQVINKTGEKADAKQGQTKWDGEKWVMSVVLDAANRNKGGFGKNLSAALQKQG